VFSGCTKYPDQWDPEREKDVSLTFYDSSADFSTYKTYAIVDAVGFVESNGDSLIIVASDKSALILDKINTRLAGLGFQKVDSSQNPDLLVNAHLLSLEVDYIGYTGGYWDMGYYYAYDPYYYGSSYYWGYGGYSYYYPYYYPYYYYSSSVGAVLIEMIDRKNVNETAKQFKMIWTGIVSGTLNSTTAVDDRIKNGIDECFDQSPYLAL